MALDTIEGVVTAGVEAQAQLDKHLAKAYEWAGKLTKITESGIKLGMVQGIAAKSIIAEARQAQGSVASSALLFSELHRKQTDACIAAGADLGSVTTAGGIPIGGVHTEGGGR
jgi:hypothetical protein